MVDTEVHWRILAALLIVAWVVLHCAAPALLRLLLAQSNAPGLGARVLKRYATTLSGERKLLLRRYLRCQPGDLRVEGIDLLLELGEQLLPQRFLRGFELRLETSLSFSFALATLQKAFPLASRVFGQNAAELCFVSLKL